MCQSPDISLVRRTIDLKYASERRATSLRWLLVNAALLAVLVYDLWCWCGGALAAGEALAALVLLANCAAHAASLVARPAAPRDTTASSPPRADKGEVEAEEPGSLSPARSWRAGDSPPSPPRGGAVRGAAGGAGGGSPRAEPGEFIADGRALAAYIRQAEARSPGPSPSSSPCPAPAAGRLLPAPPRAHQLSVLPERGGGVKENAEDETVGVGGVGAGGGGPDMWRRLGVDPERLTEYNLNLRLWLHVTVVGRVARALSGEAPPGALQPFLAPFADRQYVADRIVELSRGGCLSAYRWDGGGRGWRAGGERPCDADLLLHLFAAYMDAVAPAGSSFSARHLAGAGQAGAGHAGEGGALLLRRVARWPPQYAVEARGARLAARAGRNNLLHALLLLLAAAARDSPPALCRLHLGPAGLNMLWILGR